MVGDETEPGDHHRRTHEQRNRDRYHGGATAGQRGNLGGRSAHEVGAGRQQQQATGSEADRRPTDIGDIQQPAAGGTDEQQPDRPEQAAQTAHCQPLGSAGAARYGERGADRVEGGDRHQQPQPCGRGGVPCVEGAGFEDRDGHEQCAECMLLIVHSGQVVDEPGSFHLAGRSVGAGRLRRDLGVDRQTGDAHRPLAELAPFVGQAIVELGRLPEPAQPFAEHAVPATARSKRAAHGHAPRAEALADRTNALADQAALAAHEGEFVVGQRLPHRSLRERSRLGQSVTRPMVGERRPDVLGVVPHGRHVVTHPVGRRPPAGGRVLAVQPPQRPVHLAGVVDRVRVGARLVGSQVVVGEQGPRRLDLAGQEPAEGGHQLVVAVVPGEQPALGQRRDGERVRARLHGVAGGDSGPAVALDDVVERPFEAPLGAVEGTFVAACASLVERRHHTGVTHDVVVVGLHVADAVVFVQPGAVGLLVVDQPGHGCCRCSFGVGDRDVGAVLGR